jgi:hypothetical protein
VIGVQKDRLLTITVIVQIRNDLRITWFSESMVYLLEQGGTAWTRRRLGGSEINGERNWGRAFSAVQNKRTLCIHRLAEDRNRTVRFNNFLVNPAASTHEMLVTSGRKTNRRATGRHVLAIMVTADVLFPTQEDNKRGFGLDRVWLAAAKLPKRGRGCDGVHAGLFLHPVLAVDAAHGGVIGLVDCIVLNRTEGRVGTAKTHTQKKLKTHRKRTADDKESRGWLQATEMAGDGHDHHGG